MTIESIFEEIREVPEDRLEELHIFIKNLIERPKPHDWWDDLSDAEKQSIARGLDDIKNGRVKSHEEVMRKYAGRF